MRLCSKFQRDVRALIVVIPQNYWSNTRQSLIKYGERMYCIGDAKYWSPLSLPRW